MGIKMMHMDAEAKAGRKPSGSGPRSIAALNAEQLDRKRAVDRACQRTLRQKKRERIRHLESRVRELLGDRADEFRAAEERGLALEKELRRLRAILDKQKVDVVDEPAIPISSSLRVVPKIESGEGSQDLRNYDPFPSSKAASTAGPSKSTSLPFKPDISNAGVPSHIKTDDTIEVGSMLLITKPYEEPKVTTSTSFMMQPSPHVWEIAPALEKPQNPVEKILYGMVENQRALFTTNTGITGTELAGPRIPDLSVLVAPERFGSRPVHTVARMISELLSRITYRTFVEKLGAFMVMYPIYQWLIMHNSETYYNLPSWLLPVHQQRTTPHPVWISALGFPKLREVVIENQEKYTTEEFQFLFIAHLNCNWPHGIEAALSWKDGGVTVSKAFWDHTRDMKNWTLDEPFVRRYPGLRAVCPVTKYGEGGV